MQQNKLLFLEYIDHAHKHGKLFHLQLQQCPLELLQDLE